MEACIGELRDLVESLGDAEKRTALLAALGLDARFRGRNLGERREEYLATFTLRERRGLKTLQRWEDWAIEVVADLVQGDATFNRLRDEPANATSPTTPLHPLGSLPTVKLASVSYFSDAGIPVRVEYTRSVIAPAPDSNPLVVTANIYLTENRKGIITIEATFGCRIYRQYHTGDNSIVTIFEIFKRLSPEDGLYSFGYRVLFDCTVISDPVLWLDSPEHTLNQYDARIVFGRDRFPLRAWWFVNSVNYGRIEPTPSEGKHLQVLDDGHYLFKTFNNPVPYLAHGIAWVWNEGPVGGQSIDDLDPSG